METEIGGRSWVVDVDPTWWHDDILGLICLFKIDKFGNIRTAKHFRRFHSSIVHTCLIRETYQKITRYSDIQHEVSQCKGFTINHQWDIVNKVVKIDKSYKSIFLCLWSSCWILNEYCFNLSSCRTENKVCPNYENKQWTYINPLKPELYPICYLLALLAHHFSTLAG